MARSLNPSERYFGISRGLDSFTWQHSPFSDGMTVLDPEKKKGEPADLDCKYHRCSDMLVKMQTRAVSYCDMCHKEFPDSVKIHLKA